MKAMKFAEFFISGNKLVISMPTEGELKKLLDGLKKLGIELDVEVLSLCG